MSKASKQTILPIGSMLGFSAFFLLILTSLVALAIVVGSSSEPSTLILSSEDYHDAHFQGIWEKLYYRVKVQPINLVFLLVFLCAVIHTFVAFSFQRRVKKQHMHEENVPAAAVGIIPHTAKNSNFFSEMLYFFGEVEVVFGVWCIPLLLAISYVYDWKTALNYVNALNYNEALFIMVSLALTSTRPILQLAEKWLGKVASLGGNSPSAWWLTLLTVGPFLGAVFKESVAMTILAMLLSRYFYKFHPTPRLAYTTLALSVSICLCSWHADKLCLLFRLCRQRGMEVDYAVHVTNFRLESPFGDRHMQSDLFFSLPCRPHQTGQKCCSNTCEASPQVYPFLSGSQPYMSLY